MKNERGNAEEKGGIGRSVRGQIPGKQIALFVDYLGLTVAEISELRGNLYKEGCEMHVLKNNILRRATKRSGHDFDDAFVGPNAVVLSMTRRTRRA